MFHSSSAYSNTAVNQAVRNRYILQGTNEDMGITRQLKEKDTRYSSILPAKVHGAAKKVLPKCSNIPVV